MDFLSVKKMVEQVHPGKKVEVTLDTNCIQKIEFDLYSSKSTLNPIVLYTKARVNVEGLEPVYMDIKTHRQPMSFKQAREVVAGIKDFILTREYAETVSPQKMAEDVGISIEDAQKVIEAKMAEPVDSDIEIAQ